MPDNSVRRYRHVSAEVEARRFTPCPTCPLPPGVRQEGQHYLFNDGSRDWLICEGDYLVRVGLGWTLWAGETFDDLYEPM
jgi:hypothetical protein